MTKPELDGFWIGGANSLVHPSALPEGQFAWGYNVINRGGIVQTRPGFAYRGAIVGQRLQGMKIFRPRGETPKMLVAVDGRIYVSRYPFNNFGVIETLTFSSTAQFINMEVCLRSVKRNIDGSLTIIEPKPIVMIMDGESPTGYWDGLEGKHLVGGAPTFGTPVGLWMKWFASRLWFSRGPQLFASDLGDPTTCSENEYLAEQSGFQLPGDVTGILSVPNPATLLAFTEESTTAFQASERDRAKWKTTPKFQDEILPDIGCLAGRTAITHYGVAKWLSQYGHIDFDAARSALVSSRLLVNDGAMLRSKRLLFPDVSGACSATIENIVLLSVPAGDRYNSHTWALDQSPVGETGAAPPAWAGAWIGPRPVQWAKTVVNRRQRLYCAAYDQTVKDGTKIHIWEAFDESRKDNNGNPIRCQFTTKQTSYGGLRGKFLYAEIAVVELLGTVQLTGHVTGQRGKWHEILNTTLTAQEGSIGAPGQTVIHLDTILESYRPQSRMVPTKEFTMQDAGCHPETAEGLDDAGFQICLEWTGRMGVASITIYSKEGNQVVAKCYESEAGKINAVTEDGEKA